VLQEAEYIYAQAQKDNRFSEWLSKPRALRYLVQRKLCSFNEDEDIKTLEKTIEYKKVGLYLSHFQNKEFAKQLRRELAILKKNYTKKKNIRHWLDDYTLDGFADNAKNHYIFYRIISDEEGNAIWDSFEDVHIPLLEAIVGEYWRVHPTEIEYKEIARTEPWNSLWSINKLANFRVIGNSQRNLVLYTHMYENAYKHPDCPSEKVITDTDMFEGWMIHVRRKQDDERKQNTKEHIDAKHPNAGEIYIPVQTNEEAIEVDSFNNASGRILKKKRGKFIEQQGQVADKELTKLDQRG
jgi:hypothetical protein